MSVCVCTIGILPDFGVHAREGVNLAGKQARTIGRVPYGYVMPMMIDRYRMKKEDVNHSGILSLMTSADH